jgi:hypothetical protein
MSKKVVPLSGRKSKFYGEEDFKTEIDIGREYVEGDIDFRVILYRVDYEKTNVDDLYGEVEAHQIKYKPPVELSCMLSLKPKTNKAFNPNGSLIREEWGNLEFSIYEEQLTELDVDINKGDYIGYPVREDYLKYFTVIDNDKVNDDTRRLLGGKRGFYRKIICVPIDDSEFAG